MTRNPIEIDALMNAGRFPEACDLASRDCQQSPLDPEAWYLRAATHAAMNEWEEVVNCCQKVIALAPAHVGAHHNMAASLAKLGRLAAAADSFARVLELDARDSGARIALASCLKGNGKAQDALMVLEQGLRLTPDNPDFHTAYADTLFSTGNTDSAAVSYQRAVELDPESSLAHYGFACVLQSLARLTEACQHFESAIALNPALAGAHGRLGSIYSHFNRWDEALACLRRFLALRPDDLTGLNNYAFALKGAGRLNEANEIYRRALALHPDSDLARYFVAAIGDGAPPAQAPAGYVKDLFDSYAGRFEQHLVENLDYKVPQIVAQTLRGAVGDTSRLLRILDLGCGTGLAGREVRSMASHLVGVDLSGKMIDIARQKGGYDELHVAEAGDFLATCQSSFDAILAADVFVYVGDLSRIVTRAASILDPGGLLVFSVERHTHDAPYVLQGSARYAHSRQYIRTLAHTAGLEELQVNEQVLRVDSGAPIVGDLFLLRAPA